MKVISDKAAGKEIERQALASLLTYNEFIPEVVSIFKSEYFNSDSKDKRLSVHGTIFSLICSLFQEKGKVDQTMLILKLDQVGLREFNGLDMSLYVRSLFNITVNKEFVLDYFREVFKLHTCRQLFTSLGKAQNYISNSLSEPLRDILDNVQSMTADCMSANIEEKCKIVDVYEALPGFLDDRATQVERTRLETGFKTFDDWYGGIYIKGVYVFAAPAKVGKSTFLGALANQMVELPQNNVKVLILDTELETEFNLSRLSSSLTGENEFEFLEGSFAKNKRIVDKIQGAIKEKKHLKGRVFHSYVANLGIDDILSFARRWYVTNIKPGEYALIIYDYIKLAGGQTVLSDSWKEYQEIGEKTDKLKKFVSSLPRAALATSVQTNASGNIAMSQQIKWFANNVYILDRKTLQEIQNDGIDNGTHKLIEVVTRNQGKHAKGANNSFKVQTPDGKIDYMQNHINFDFSNFKVVEKSTHEEVMHQKASKLKAEESHESAEF